MSSPTSSTTSTPSAKVVSQVPQGGLVATLEVTGRSGATAQYNVVVAAHHLSRIPAAELDTYLQCRGLLVSGHPDEAMALAKPLATGALGSTPQEDTRNWAAKWAAGDFRV